MKFEDLDLLRSFDRISLVNKSSPLLIAFIAGNESSSCEKSMQPSDSQLTVSQLGGGESETHSSWRDRDETGKK